MKRTRSMLTVMTVLLILSFTITTVAADTPPPVVVDPGNGNSSQAPDLSGFTIRPDNYLPPDKPVTVEAVAAPISPAYEMIFKAKPTFFFYRDYTATRYNIEIYANGTSSYSTPGTCISYYCSFQSPVKLPYISYFTPDVYKWRVQAKVGDVWQPWSDWVPFMVLSKGFNDTFLTDSMGSRWFNVNHGSFTWFKTATKSQLRAEEEAFWWGTAYATDYFFNVDYTVRMQRKVNETNSNAVIIWGDLFPASASNELHDGIYFQYDNAFYETGDPSWAVWLMQDGYSSLIHDWTASAAIKPYSWNELRVVAQYPFIDLWINGTYLGWFPVTALKGGYVGVAMAADTPPSGPLWVDWAKAVPLKDFLFMDGVDHDPAKQIGLDPVPAGMNPTGGSNK